MIISIYGTFTVVAAMAHHELESLTMAIDHAATLAPDEEMMTNVELAQLLSHRLQSTSGQ